MPFSFSRFLSAVSPNLGCMTPEIPADLLHSPTFQAERIRKCLRDGSEEVLSKYSVRMREYWILGFVAGVEPPTQVAIAAALGVDPSDMVRLIDSVESRGWVRRELDPRDRRRHLVHISDSGRALYGELSVLVAQSEAKVLAAAGDVTTAQAMLRRLADQLVFGV